MEQCLEVRDLPSHDEGLCTLIGTLEARVKAAQQFLKRLEEARPWHRMTCDST